MLKILTLSILLVFVVCDSHPYILTFNNIHNGYSYSISGSYNIENNKILLFADVQFFAYSERRQLPF